MAQWLATTERPVDIADILEESTDGNHFAGEEYKSNSSLKIISISDARIYQKYLSSSYPH